MSTTQGIYRRVSVRLWADERFRQLSPVLPSAQALWLYVLTGPHTTAIPGAFQCGRAAMAEALGWSSEDFDRCMAEILEAGMAEFEPETRLWFVPRAIRHNPPANPNVVVSWKKAFLMLPEGAMRQRIAAGISEALEGMTAPHRKAFEEGGKASQKASRKASVKASRKASVRAPRKASEMPPSEAFGMPSTKQEQEQEQEQDFGADAPTPASPASGSSSRLPPCPYEKIQRAYNETLPELPPVRVLGDARKRAIAGFWRWVLTSERSDGSRRAEDASGAMTWIGDYFKRARHNDFLMGRTPRREGHANWRCDIDFLLKEKGRSFVLEKTDVVAE